jgi:preprotein translocase subunit SecY
MQNAKMKQPSTDDILSIFNASGLKTKLIFTFAMIAIFRLGVALPIFGIDNEIFSKIAQGNNIIGFIDLFSGGALANISILALGIGPYITASIIMQLLTVIVPHLEQLQKEEGEAGRRKISQYTRYFTVFIAFFQATIFLTYLLHQAPAAILPGVNHTVFFVGSALILTAGSVFVMWLAELMTERGIGNGGSLLIFVGIISRIPYYFKQTFELVANDTGLQFGLILLLAIFFATMVLIVIMQEAVRNVLIVIPKRQVGNKIYGGINNRIPFKMNPGGVMPIIFAIAILLFPTTVISLIGQTNLPAGAFKDAITWLSTVLSPSGWVYYMLYFLLIVFLTFFYASIMPNMQPKEIAKNLKKYGSSIPGIKPGRPTEEALDRILSRITLLGAICLGVVALIPSGATYITNITTLQGIGATSLIIMVGVALDFINQIKTQLLAKSYESFLKE